MSGEEKLETTLGDLVVALTDETVRFVHDEQEVYKIVSYLLVDLLCRSGPVSKSWH